MARPSRREALALLYERHYAELVRLAFAMTSDWGLAEELAQEAFVRVWRSWGNIRDQESAPAYLRTTVVNLARRSLRRKLQERRAWSSAVRVTFWAGSVWASTEPPGALVRIDPTSSRIVGKAVPAGTSPIYIAAGPSGLWVADFGIGDLLHFALPAAVK